MIPQNGTFTLSIPWHEARFSHSSVNPRSGCQVLVMCCAVPLSADDLDDLQEVSEGIVGFSAVRLSRNKKDLFIEFADPRITPQDMSALTTELFRQAARHSCTLPRRAASTHHDFESAMAVHSDIGPRFDEYDR